ELRQQGIPFVLASARSPEGMLPIAKELDVMDNPIACYNGDLVVKDLNKKDYTTILNHELEIEEVRQVVQIVHQRFPNVSINLYSGSDWYVERRDKWTEIESEITQLQPIITDLDQFVSEHQSPIHKLLLISEPKEIEQVLDYL